MKKIKVVIIDDSPIIRMIVQGVFKGQSDIDVVGEAADGKAGVEVTLKSNPDVVISDYIMEKYDGLYVIKKLMDKKPTPIILLSSLDRTNTSIFDALDAGGYDFLDKPGTEADAMTNFEKRLVAGVRQAAKVNPNSLTAKINRANTFEHSFGSILNYDAILLGASTGGPSAIELIIRNLPNNIPVPIFIAQHMPQRFLESFSKRLDKITELKVQLARSGAMAKPKHIYIMPGDSNMKVLQTNEGVVFKKTSKQYEAFNSPSIDCLFESAAAVYKNKAIAGILTGMGKDGGLGLQKLKSAGSYTLAQDEKSSVVYGMPKHASDTNVVNSMVPLKDIAGFMINSLS